jgi:hypothetical protein
VALWPLLVALEDAGSYPFLSTHARIERDLTALGLTFLDTSPAFTGAQTASLWVHEVDHHPNAEAHRRFTAAISGTVRDALARARGIPSP